VSKNPEQKEAARLAKEARRARKQAGGGKRSSRRFGTHAKHSSGHNDGLPKQPTS
jgi:hypothetical protein